MTAIAGPDLFQIIESANFWAEQMNDHVAEIDQYPIRIRQAFKLWRFPGLFLDLLGQMRGNRTHMTGRAARSDDHDVCEGRFFRQVNDGEVFGFIIFQSGDDRV